MITLMNRPLEFRAWHIPTQTLFMVFCFTTEYVYPVLPVETTDEERSDASENPYPIADCILMQFTGLYDSQGQKVFEGDILYSFYPGDGRIRPLSTEYWRLIAFRAGGFCELAYVDEEASEIETMWLSQYSATYNDEPLPDKVVGCYYQYPDLLDLNTESAEVPDSFTDDLILCALNTEALL